MGKLHAIRSLRLLIVDADASSHGALGEVLSRLGYEAEFARDGEDALAFYQAARRAGNAFNAVIMDLTVPGGMGGREAIRHLLALDADARAIAASGCLGTTDVKPCGLHGFRAFLAKPYNLQELIRALALACD